MIETQALILLKNATIVDASSPFHLQKVDLLIDKGIVSTIKPNMEIPSAYQVDLKGCYISGGWCDIGTHCGEPGEEVHETIATLTQAACAGGYTRLAIFSNATRPFDNRHIISDIRHRTSNVALHPVGTVTKSMHGHELVEMLDLSQSTVALFTDGFHRIYDNALLCRAMEYAQQCNGTILTIPGAKRSLKRGLVNESKVSAQMGIPGLPGYEEVASLSGELSLASYVECPFFAHLMSHEESLDLIRYRKEQGLQITASVSALHLLHHEEAVADFDENFKVLPPLRSASHQEALQNGLKDGTIDLVVSNHVPISDEQKQREFGESPFGAIGLETAFYALATALPQATALDISQWLSVHPRKALGLDPIRIESGNEAEFTLFSMQETTRWVPEKAHSLSNNDPHAEREFTGRILGTIKKNQLYLNL